MTKLEFRKARCRNRELVASLRRARKWTRFRAILAPFFEESLRERSYHEALFPQMFLRADPIGSAGWPAPAPVP